MSKLSQASFGLVVAAATLLAGCGPSQPQGLQLDPEQAVVDARTALLQAAQSEDPTIRCNAMEAMALTMPGQAGPIYVDALRSPVVGVQFAAAMSIGDTKYQPAKPLMLEMMKEPATDPNVQCALIYALHQLGDDSHTSRLADLLVHGGDSEIQANAALAMGKMGQPSAVAPLKRLATYKIHPRVELQVRESLAALGDQASLGWLAMEVQWGLLDERLIATQALGRARQMRYKAALVKAIRPDEHPLLRVVAAGALARMQDNRGCALAVQATINPAEVYEEAFRKKDVQASVDAHQLYQLQTHGALALGLMGHPEAADVLAPLLRSPSGSARVAAAKSILVLLSSYAPPAPAALTDTTPTVQPRPAQPSPDLPTLPTLDPLLQRSGAKD